jgi:hypothetical protein
MTTGSARGRCSSPQLSTRRAGRYGFRLSSVAGTEPILDPRHHVGIDPIRILGTHGREVPNGVIRRRLDVGGQQHLDGVDERSQLGFGVTRADTCAEPAVEVGEREIRKHLIVVGDVLSERRPERRHPRNQELDRLEIGRWPVVVMLVAHPTSVAPSSDYFPADLDLRPGNADGRFETFRGWSPCCDLGSRR